MESTETLIIGAGMTGLAASYFLGRNENRLFEAEPTAGGLCRSRPLKGYRFDYSGHVLHFRRPWVRALVDGLLRNNLKELRRNSSVFYMGRFIPYPFQANFHKCPKQVVYECLHGYFKSCLQAPPAATTRQSLMEWSLATFGEGITKHFFRPYNEKIWCTPLAELTSDWTSRFVPKPKVEAIIAGALGIAQQGLGYNASMLYPRSGIGSLPSSLVPMVADIHHQEALIAVDWRRKRATFASGRQVQYHNMITTIPLKQLGDMLKSVPKAIHESFQLLAHNRVVNFNIGIRKSRLSRRHWIYFPEPRYPFYRVGIHSNLSPTNHPRGTSSLYVECAFPPNQAVDLKRLQKKMLDGLIDCGLLASRRLVDVIDTVDIHCAYVIQNFDYFRKEAILEWLAARNIHSIGRYGEWKYSSIEDTFVDALKAARAIGRVDSERLPGDAFD